MFSVLIASLALLPGLASSVSVAPSNDLDVRDIEVYHHEDTGVSLEFTKNSGICETTPGVNSYSGYINVGKNMSMWFWFFESRKDPTQAPLGLWFNGGPGCSSMEGVLQENGPCYFQNNNATNPILNPYSWNEYANMLYVDEPIGVGFSYGTEAANSSITAAAYVWTFLQAWYARFPQYTKRDLGLFTESYGGHIGPAFVSHFESQNAAIKKGTLKGTRIPIITLGINNGVFNPVDQYSTYPSFAINNTYNRFLNATGYANFTHSYNINCAPGLQKCAATNQTADCAAAATSCGNYEQDILNLMFALNINWYDVRYPADDLGIIPPMNWVSYLSQPNVSAALGVRKNHPFVFCSDSTSAAFDTTGDIARSAIPALSAVVQAGVRTIVWTGDADWIANWFGALRSANEVVYQRQKAFQAASLEPYTVRGVQKGLVKQVGNLAFMRVFESGHQLTYYQRELALQVFKQMMQTGVLVST